MMQYLANLILFSCMAKALKSPQDTFQETLGKFCLSVLSQDSDTPGEKNTSEENRFSFGEEFAAISQ